MSLPSALTSLALLSLSIVAAPRPARASHLHVRLYAGAAQLRNLPEGGGSSGLGVASQLDLGARLTRSLALHGTLFADASRWMRFDEGGSHEYEASTYGLGVGATGHWRRLALGIVTGAQLAWYPDRNDPSSGSLGAGIGPFVSGTAGYVVASDAFELGLHGLARYHVGKDPEDPAAYHLGLVLSIGVSGRPKPDAD